MPAVVDLEKCTGCGDCVKECPTDAITLENEKAVVDPDTCVDCGACVDVCPTQALSMQ